MVLPAPPSPFFSLCRAQDDADGHDDHRSRPRLRGRRVRRGGQSASAAKKVKKGLAPQIRGLHGTAEGWRVSTGSPATEGGP